MYREKLVQLCDFTTQVKISIPHCQKIHNNPHLQKIFNPILSLIVTTTICQSWTMHGQCITCLYQRIGQHSFEDFEHKPSYPTSKIPSEKTKITVQFYFLKCIFGGKNFFIESFMKDSQIKIVFLKFDFIFDAFKIRLIFIWNTGCHSNWCWLPSQCWSYGKWFYLNETMVACVMM